MRSLAALSDVQPPTATERVFDALYSAIMTLELPPGTKVSEAELAKKLCVSRQPVRDAFYRLSEMGFLRIRPQRPTTITHISETALLDARFHRTALEVECLREAVQKATKADMARLDDLLKQQARAIDAQNRLEFHGLDDAFHRAIAEIAGHPSAWNLIRDQKVHLDRVRYLALATGAQSTLEEHRAIVHSLKTRNSKAAETALRTHLSTIVQVLPQVRVSHAAYFVD